MKYFEEVRELTKYIPTSIVDFSLQRDKTSPPTQASSNFITNKEQGDWAEDLIFRAINETSKNYIAVKYGKSDNLVAGDEGFDHFYNEFQNELDNIGKRPDLLIFRKSDFDSELGYNISAKDHSCLFDYVKKAVGGLEIRSSAFFINKYESHMKSRTNLNMNRVFEIKNEILDNYYDILEDPKKRSYLKLLQTLDKDSVQAVSFRRPSWYASERLSKLSALFKELKEAISIIQKRDFLSITPKVEDLKVVYKWIEAFNVPHFYVQVFFDKSFAISFKDILYLITQPEKEGEFYEIGKDVKNQNKTTIKINTKKSTQIAYKIDEPQHFSVKKEMQRGKVLYYVSFKNGTAYLDIENLKTLLNIEDF